MTFELRLNPQDVHSAVADLHPEVLRLGRCGLPRPAG